MKRSDGSESYNRAAAVLEGKRCLNCADPPCNRGCPAGIDVRKFVQAIAKENLTGAARAIRSKNILGLTCGILCPVEHLCEEACSRSALNYAITIGRLQRFACEQDYADGLYQPERQAAKGAAVAVVGAGPAGLAAAAELRLRGYKVTVFDRGEGGGMLRSGVPVHRLPPEVVEKEVAFVRRLGVTFATGKPVRSLDKLMKQGFKAAFLGLGLNASLTIGLPGEDLRGVYTALDFLARANASRRGERRKPAIGKRVVVIGGGDVAMDCARSAKLLGARRVEIVCLEAPNEMPATRAETDAAWEEGILFNTRIMPKKIVGKDGKVVGLRGVAIEWKDPDRYVPSNAVAVPGATITLAADTIIEAIGQRADKDAATLVAGLKQERGRVVVDSETWMTSRAGVFAGGDIILGGGPTVVRSVFQGKSAAIAMDAWMQAQR